MRRGRERIARCTSSYCSFGGSGPGLLNCTGSALAQFDDTGFSGHVFRNGNRLLKRHFAYLTSQVGGNSTNKNGNCLDPCSIEFTLNCCSAIRRPAGYWSDQTNQRAFLENIASQLGINQVPWVNHNNPS